MTKARDRERLRRLRALVEGLTGRRLVLMLASALMMVLMFPSAGLSVLAWVCLVPFLLALDGFPARTAFTAGLVTFLVAKAGTIYWLVYTINHYGYIHIVPALLIFLLLIGTIATLWGSTFYAVARLTGGGGLPMTLVLPVSWVAQEWVQTWFLSGFPWGFLGYAPYRHLFLVQSADLLGVWGLSFLIALVNAAVYEGVRFLRKTRRSFPVAPVAVAAALFAANLAYGAVRLPQVRRAMEGEKPFQVGVLQGNIDQNEKWRDPAVRAQTPTMYLEMAETANRKGDLSLILLPETALPVWQHREARLNRTIAEFGIRSGTYVLVGCPSTARDADGERINYNSAVLVSPRGEAVGWYHKNRLVPFGEYIPFKRTLKKLLGDLVSGTGNFSAWGRLSAFDFPEGRFGIFICYETIYPDLVRRIANQGATFLPTITNDAWFGNTSAPHQHLMMVAMRAIENRLYVPRAANTGISGIVDPTGQILYESPVYERLYYTGEVRTMHLTTLYRRVGDVLAYLCAGGFVAMAAGTWWRVRRAAKTS